MGGVMSFETRLAASTILALSLVGAAAALAQDAEQIYEDVKSAIDPLILGETNEKIAAAQKLTKLRAVYSVPALEKAYGDPSAAVRKAVVGALAAIVDKGAVKVLAKAATDEDKSVALLAVKALGDMHTDDSYAALTKLIGAVKEPEVKDAVLDGLRQWNQPHAPLPAPNELPKGKKVPPMPEPKKVEPVAPPPEEKPGEKPGKKPGIKVVETKPPQPKVEIKEVQPPPGPGIEIKEITPGAKGATVPAKLKYDEQAALEALESASGDVDRCIKMHSIEPPYVPVELTLSAGGHVSEVYVMRKLEPEAWDCIREVMTSTEFPPASESYSLKHEYHGGGAIVEGDEMEEEEEQEEAEPAKPDLPPALSIEMWDMAQASTVTFEAATASIDQGGGRVYSMHLRGGFFWRFIGAGVLVPFSGASSRLEDTNNERVIFDNLGIWVRALGSKSFGKVKLSYGGALTVYTPTGTAVQWDILEGRDTTYLPAMGAYYAGYYRQGIAYPDLQESFKASIRPDLDVALAVGPLSFQLELGFDFVILGDAFNPDPFWMASMDLDDVYMFHFGFGSAVLPLPWLQLAMELTGVVEISGRSGQSWAYDNEDTGDRAGTELFVTPSVSLLLPVGKAGSGHLSLGLRIPLGEIGSAAGPMQLDPILVVATGFRFD
jgi:hypothetical protein